MIELVVFQRPAVRLFRWCRWLLYYLYANVSNLGECPSILYAYVYRTPVINIRDPRDAIINFIGRNLNRAIIAVCAYSPSVYGFQFVAYAYICTCRKNLILDFVDENLESLYQALT
ncbi:hypothetical protein ACFW04_010173 [Cataglyphis niger]